MPMPPCHHARPPRGDSVPSVIVLFRVDHCRIPVEISHFADVRYARYGASPPWLCNSGCRRLRPSPDPLTGAESGNLTCTGGTAHSVCYPTYQSCCETNAGDLLVKGLAISSFFLLDMFVSHVRLLTSPSGIVTIDRHIDHFGELIATRKGPVLAVTLDYVTSPTK